MTDELREYLAASRTARVGVILILLAMLSAFAISRAEAQSVTFGASVTNADERLSTAVTWDAPGASGCVASGHASWTGAKAASGTEQLPPITLSGTYSLTLSCSFPGDRTARVSWQPPTQNTDGSALTNLAGYRVVWGTAADALTQVIQIANPGTTSHTLSDLSPGAKFFAVKAYNSLGVESALSNVASKTITAGTTREAAVALTVNPRPNPAVVSVE